MEENIELRKLLWINHGHSQLYGDDGEMQCHECGLDFKRDTIKQIAEGLKESSLRQTPKLQDNSQEVITYQQTTGHPFGCQCTACWKRRAYL
jgi:hypothetical protein